VSLINAAPVYFAYKKCLITLVASFIMRRSFAADCNYCGWSLNLKLRMVFGFGPNSDTASY